MPQKQLQDIAYQDGIDYSQDHVLANLASYLAQKDPPGDIANPLTNLGMKIILSLLKVIMCI
jgi:hypothetical protein